MGFWEVILILGALGIVSEMYRARLKTRERVKQQGTQMDGLAERLDRMEARIANLETLVIDQHKHQQFDRALDR